MKIIITFLSELRVNNGSNQKTKLYTDGVTDVLYTHTGDYDEEVVLW